MKLLNIFMHYSVSGEKNLCDTAVSNDEKSKEFNNSQKLSLHTYNDTTYGRNNEH